MANQIKRLNWSVYPVILIILILLMPVKIGASRGSHTGVVTAVEYNSNIVWGANVVYFKTTRESSQEDRYCVNDKAVREQLVDASKNKKEVTLHYQNDYFMWKWQCNGGETIIYRIE